MCGSLFPFWQQAQASSCLASFWDSTVCRVWYVNNEDYIVIKTSEIAVKVGNASTVCPVTNTYWLVAAYGAFYCVLKLSSCGDNVTQVIRLLVSLIIDSSFWKSNSSATVRQGELKIFGATRKNTWITKTFSLWTRTPKWILVHEIFYLGKFHLKQTV